MRRRAVLVGLAAASMAGCSARKPKSKAVDEVTYLTGFSVFAREMYVAVAIALGYFDEVGVKVTVKPGAAGLSNATLLQAGQAHFAATEFSVMVQGLATGKLDIALTAAVNQHTQVAIMTLTGYGITRPHDLAGKVVAGAVGPATPEVLFPGYADLAGVDKKTVRWVNVPAEGLAAQLASGKVQAIGQFVTGKPAITAATANAGRGDVVVLPYSDYISDLYGNVQMTSKKLLAENPDLVRRFTTAILRGLRYAVDHPEEAAQIIHKAAPTTSVEVGQQELAILHDYVGEPFGAYEPHRVAQSLALLKSIGIISGQSQLQPEDIVDFSVVKV